MGGAIVIYGRLIFARQTRGYLGLTANLKLMSVFFSTIKFQFELVQTVLSVVYHGFCLHFVVL